MPRSAYHLNLDVDNLREDLDQINHHIRMLTKRKQIVLAKLLAKRRDLHELEKAGVSQTPPS